MRIVIAHNYYLQRGGEDSVVESEIALLRQHGHEVVVYERNNEDIASSSINKLKLAADTIWSRRTVDDVDRLIKTFAPDIIHAHNTFPLISPSIYWAAKRRQIPIVQTLHNFRLACPQALLLRDGTVCEDCLGKVPWRAVAHKCYRESRAQTAVVAMMLQSHRLAGTWSTQVDRFIALNQFCKSKFIESGLPEEKISIKPNFVDLPQPLIQERRGLLYVGRLSKEKGVNVLADAVEKRPTIGSIDVIGTGPLETSLRATTNLRMLGPRQSTEVYRAMREAVALVLPSICYENFPRTIVEAFANGTPVIASKLGGMAEIVEHGKTGLLFESGNASELAETMTWAIQHPSLMESMGIAAREKYEQQWSADVNIKLLVQIYTDAISANARN